MTSGRFEIHPTTLSGADLLRRSPRGDARGLLDRMFCTDELQSLLGGRSIRQINRTVTRQRGTVRGLHYQTAPHAEMKFISCLRGEVFDVAVDLRRGSPTFLGWHARRLSQSNFESFVIPEGFAHGFQTLCDDCELLYLHTAAYQPSAEAGLSATDPLIAIQWPLEITQQSDRDRGWTLLEPSFTGILT